MIELTFHSRESKFFYWNFLIIFSVILDIPKCKLSILGLFLMIPDYFQAIFKENFT